MNVWEEGDGGRKGAGALKRYLYKCQLLVKSGYRVVAGENVMPLVYVPCDALREDSALV